MGHAKGGFITSSNFIGGSNGYETVLPVTTSGSADVVVLTNYEYAKYWADYPLARAFRKIVGRVT